MDPSLCYPTDSPNPILQSPANKLNNSVFVQYSHPIIYLPIELMYPM